MDDLSAKPADHEREALSARIDRAAAAGQISSVDRDIRLANVKSAQSRAELDLMSRDLDQLEGALGAGPTPAPDPRPYNTFDPGQVSSGGGPTVVVSGSRRALVVALIAVVVTLVAGGGLGLASLFHHTDSSPPRALPPAQTQDVDASDAPSDAPSNTVSGYGLTAKGLTGFLSTYAKKFGTPRAVQLVLYPDYAVVEVPVQGGRGRQAGWLYRPATGWTSFGGVTAVFPGSSTLDTRQIDVAALTRNIVRARRTLKVDHPSQTYVIVRYIPTFETAPSVDVYVANGFNESGYLATRLDGAVVRSFPFGG